MKLFIQRALFSPLCFQKDILHGTRRPQVDGMAGAHPTAREPSQLATSWGGRRKLQSDRMEDVWRGCGLLWLAGQAWAGVLWLPRGTNNRWAPREPSVMRQGVCVGEPRPIFSSARGSGSSCCHLSANSSGISSRDTLDNTSREPGQSREMSSYWV